MTSNSNTTRKKSLKVYLFDGEKVIIEDKAAATNQTASEYLRNCALKRIIREKPPADLIKVREYGGAAKSQLMQLRHLSKKTNDQQIINTVENAIALVDKAIAAAFKIKLESDKDDDGVCSQR